MKAILSDRDTDMALLDDDDEDDDDDDVDEGQDYSIFGKLLHCVCFLCISFFIPHC